MLEAQLSVKGTFEEIAAFIQRNSIAMNMPALISSTAASMIQNNDHADDGDNTPPNLNAPQFDTAGISWDERIHSKTKALTNDGTWRKKRGVTAADITAVEAELKQRAATAAGMYMQPGGGLPGAPQMQNPPVHPQFNPNMPGGPQYQQPGPNMPGGPQYQQPAQPQMPQPYQPQHYQPQQYQQPGQPQTPQQIPGAIVVPQNFDAFMSHLSNKMVQLNGTATPLDANYLATVCQRLSAHFQRPINSITDVGNDPNVIGVAVSFINADGRWL